MGRTVLAERVGRLQSLLDAAMVCALIASLSVPHLAVASEADSPDADHNGDGVSDNVWTNEQGGSGWATFRTCARDGLTGDQACRVTLTTAYARFSGYRLELEPASDNSALSMLPELACLPLDLSRPEQAALEALRYDLPIDADATVVAHWREGSPLIPEDVCMTVEEASTFPSGLAWIESGDVSDLGPGWSVYYRSTGPQERLIEMAEAGGPILIDRLDGLDLLRWDDALAVYDSAADRHTWVADFVDGTRDGYKVDRWARVDAARLTVDGAVWVRIRRSPGSSTVKIEIAPTPSEQREE